MKIFIYKLSDNNGKTYYGSSANPVKRLGQHISNKKCGYTCSSKLLEDGLTMEILESFEDIDKIECKKKAKKREGELILQGECVNIKVPGRTAKESGYASWLKNRDKNYARIDCGCGGRYSNHHKWSHFRTKKHAVYLNELSNVEPV